MYKRSFLKFATFLLGIAFSWLLLSGSFLGTTEASCPALNGGNGWLYSSTVKYEKTGFSSTEGPVIETALQNWADHNQWDNNCSDVKFSTGSNDLSIRTNNGQKTGDATAAAYTDRYHQNGVVIAAVTTFYWGAVHNSVNVWNRANDAHLTFLKKVMLHETGHTMGLAHPTTEVDGQSVMNGYDGTNDGGGSMPTLVTTCDDTSVNSILQYFANCLIGTEPVEVCINTPGSNGYSQNTTNFPHGGCEYGFAATDPINFCCMSPSPILIDTLGNGYNLTGTSNPVSFDFAGNNQPYTVGWTSANSDDAFLVLDRNGNATIDNGTELFGNFTPQPPSTHRNGFIGLAEYDKPQNGGNNDGRINSNDSIFLSLKLWQDKNHNGVSEANELSSLRSKGIYAMDLNYAESRRTDYQGNQFKYRAKIYDRNGAQVGRWAWDVYFVKQ